MYQGKNNARYSAKDEFVTSELYVHNICLDWGKRIGFIGFNYRIHTERNSTLVGFLSVPPSLVIIQGN